MAKKSEELLDYGLNAAKLTNFTVEDFFNNSLRLFSAHSNVRGLPFIGDGFKEAQRKAIEGMFRRGDSAGFDTVERLASSAATETDYHHAVGSMQGTLIGLAQNFAGSNNMNLLVPKGQFGSRRSHGASAPRYLKTNLHENFRKLFKKEDDVILDHKHSGNIKIEPKFFIPILPIILINGAEGMGTGHATHIFSYKPSDIKEAILKVLAGKELTPRGLVPFWNDFKGKVERDMTNGQVKVTGDLIIENTTTIRVTELPVGTQSDSYEDTLWGLVDKGLIKSFKNASDDTGFDFIINAPRTTTQRTRPELLKLFKLEARDTENYTCWDPTGKVKKYESAEEMLLEWIVWRLDQYERRRLKHLEITVESIRFTEESIRFVEFFLQNIDKFKNVPKQQMIDILVEAKFTDYERLLSLSLWSLTKDRIADLATKLQKEKEKLAALQADSADKMFERELKELKL